MPRRARPLLLLLALCVVAAPALAQLRGHGGPVRAVAVSPDGSRAVSGSFDATAILWSLILGYGVWGDVPNVYASVGILMLVVSGLYMIRREARLRRRQET